MNNAASDEGLRVVVLGGGTGLSTLLRGLKRHVALPTGVPRQTPADEPVRPRIAQLSAIVTVTDDGGSSGRLRQELGVPPPGDIRNCMTALSDDEELLSRLFCYRFAAGDLRGHSFGNLFLVALAAVTGDFAQAVQLSSAILKTRGEIFPSSSAGNLQLEALMKDGTKVRGETRISAGRAGIERIWLVPADAEPLPEALEAIVRADIVSIGPGSLFTSCIPNLLVRGVPEALRASHAVRAYVCNLMTQPNESTGLSAAQHIEALFNHAGGQVFDYALINSSRVPENLRVRYAEEGAVQIKVDLERIRQLGVTPIVGDYLDASTGTARHATERVTHDLLQLAERKTCP